MKKSCCCTVNFPMARTTWQGMMPLVNSQQGLEAWHKQLGKSVWKQTLPQSNFEMTAVLAGTL
jgi:hypothetical protein